MKRMRLLLVLLLTLAAALVFSGCTAIVTDDDGETYEIPMDEAEEFAREYISEEMELYISDQIKSGYTLADALGIKEEDIEQIIREEVRNAIQEEIKNGDLVDMVFEEAGISKDDLQATVGMVTTVTGIKDAKKTDEKKVEEKKTDEKKVEEKKTDEKKADEKKEESKADEKKEETKKEDARAEETKKEETSKEEPAKEETKKEEKSKEEPAKEDPAKEDKKTDEKKEDSKADEKKEESKTDEKTEEAPVFLGDGDPWVDYSLRENDPTKSKADAKDDFYHFVNRDWLSTAKIEEGTSTTSPFRNASLDTLEKGKALFDDKTLKSHDAELIQDFQSVLLDWDARDKEGVKNLEGLVLDLQKAQSTEDINRLYLEGENRFFMPRLIQYANTPSYNDSSSYVLMVVSPELFLSDPAEYAKRTEMGDRYYEGKKAEVTGLLKKFGYKQDQAEELFEKAVSFETKLSKNMLTATEQMQADYYEKTNNEMDRKELETLISDYPLFDMLEAGGYGDVKLFRVQEPAYLKDLKTLYNDKNIEEIRAFIITHLVDGEAKYLDREAYELDQAADNKISGTTGKVSDEEYAFELVKENLTTPLSKAFIEKYDSKKMKEEITGLIEEEIDYYREMLEEETWLSEETRKKAVEKLDKMRVNAVYPDKWEDYDDLSLKGKSLYECEKAIALHWEKLDSAKTGKKVDPAIKDFSILEANAFYDQQDNSINIIRGLLTDVFYHDGMSREELLGGMGVVIGHEISHAFDTNGSQFDEIGNMKNWWTDKDLKAFLDRNGKLVSYYDNITAFGGNKVSGENIKTEAVADMAGMKCVLGVAKKDKNFDYKKMFEQYATCWRRLDTYEREYYLVKQDVHPLAYLRTNVVSQQFDEFNEAFDIKKGDRMYLDPKDRILVW